MEELFNLTVASNATTLHQTLHNIPNEGLQPTNIAKNIWDTIRTFPTLRNEFWLSAAAVEG